jgi:D-aminoacyl-tRNA deacylase
VRAVVSRVSTAAVTVDGVVVGEIGPGLLSLVGVGSDDGIAQAHAMARKIHELRIFPGEDGERSASDLGLPVLVVSQFTLYADTARGRRPGFTSAADPALAERLYLRFAEGLRAAGVGEVQTGSFGAEMAVELVNDGPFTIWLDTDRA